MLSCLVRATAITQATPEDAFKLEHYGNVVSHVTDRCMRKEMEATEQRHP